MYMDLDSSIVNTSQLKLVTKLGDTKIEFIFEENLRLTIEFENITDRDASMAKCKRELVYTDKFN